MKKQSKSVFQSRDGPRVMGPQWADDSESEHCSACQIKFSTLTRRHHCRSCGEIFCGTCTAHTHALPDLDYDREVRVCRPCKAELLRSDTETVFQRLASVPKVSPPFHLQHYSHRHLRYVSKATFPILGTTLHKTRVVAVVDRYLFVLTYDSHAFVKRVVHLAAVERLYQQDVSRKKKFLRDDYTSSLNILVKHTDGELFFNVAVSNAPGSERDPFPATVQRITEVLTGVTVPNLRIAEDAKMGEYFSTPDTALEETSLLAQSDASRKGKVSPSDPLQKYVGTKYKYVLPALFHQDNDEEDEHLDNLLDRGMSSPTNRPKEIINTVVKAGLDVLRRDSRDEAAKGGRAQRRDWAAENLKRIFSEHDPIRLNTITSLLYRHAGKEEELVDNVIAEYIPEQAAKREIQKTMKKLGYDDSYIEALITEYRQREHLLLDLLSSESLHKQPSLTNSHEDMLSALENFTMPLTKDTQSDTNSDDVTPRIPPRSPPLDMVALEERLRRQSWVLDPQSPSSPSPKESPSSQTTPMSNTTSISSKETTEEDFQENISPTIPIVDVLQVLLGVKGESDAGEEEALLQSMKEADQEERTKLLRGVLDDAIFSRSVEREKGEGEEKEKGKELHHINPYPSEGEGAVPEEEVSAVSLCDSVSEGDVVRRVAMFPCITKCSNLQFASTSLTYSQERVVRRVTVFAEGSHVFLSNADIRYTSGVSEVRLSFPEGPARGGFGASGSGFPCEAAFLSEQGALLRCDVSVLTAYQIAATTSRFVHITTRGSNTTPNPFSFDLLLAFFTSWKQYVRKKRAPLLLPREIPSSKEISLIGKAEEYAVVHLGGAVGGGGTPKRIHHSPRRKGRRCLGGVVCTYSAPGGKEGTPGGGVCPHHDNRGEKGSRALSTKRKALLGGVGLELGGREEVKGEKKERREKGKEKEACPASPYWLPAAESLKASPAVLSPRQMPVPLWERPLDGLL